MIIDIIVAIILILAIIKGYRQGLIVALFSFIAFIIGLAAALKLSVVAADYIGKAVKVSDKWLQIISFAVVFLIVVLLVRLGAKFIEKNGGGCNARLGKQAWRDFTICGGLHFNFQRTTFLCRSNEFYKAGNKNRIRYLLLYSALGTETHGRIGKNYSDF